AVLSRAVAGVRAKTLVVNLPGSPKGAIESLEAVAELIPHAIDVLHGARHD
ncbi:MAG: molybdenum cofactor biosynthesis protein, partial [Acidipila sp.]|nr:molybdenum cofactor biosynthesis protein [Acidipila sp.]